MPISVEETQAIYALIAELELRVDTYSTVPEGFENEPMPDTLQKIIDDSRRQLAFLRRSLQASL